ncbi:7570_t:CDS:1, partial [Rhizophagus irregularis]
MSRQVTSPRPPPRLRDLTYIDYDIYEHPNIPAGHLHFGRNG